MDWYIYYQVEAKHAGELCARVTAMQGDLAKTHNLRAELKRRPDEKDGKHTWMEVYCGVPAEFDTLLADAVARYELPPLIVGERHVEYFLEVARCA